MKRAFDYDVLVCPKCAGSMRLIATITDREAIRTILTAAGLPADSPARTPARLPPQQDFDFGDVPPDDDSWEAA